MSEASPVRQVIERYLRAYEEGDYAACEAMFADHAVFEDPVGTRRFEGIEAIREFLRSAPAEIKIKADVHKIVECGRDAMFHYAMIITGWRDNPVGIKVYETIAIDDAGKITSLRAFWNEGSIRDL
ncbi:nuclear transport factor 2 family protein [Sphingosinicella soli]|uniref:Steroid delta-isomerase n=1 Tax=Sphingosinicella soli TaxID=333708 RepID=A0A7W7B2D2_9SPHN|nr:steroid delta-isomerase [Sphingosinicella soli]